MRQRQLAGNGDQRMGVLVGARQRNGCEQAARIGMAHDVEDILDCSHFDSLAGIHHGDPVTCLQDQAEIVRDIDHGGAEFGGDFVDQIDNSGFHRHIKRRGRLVQKQQLGIGQQRHGDDDALLLAAGNLVRIGVENPVRFGQADAGNDFARPLHRLFRAGAFVEDRNLAELVADAHGRIERRHRLLIDHGDLGAAQITQFLFAHGPHVAAFEENLAGDNFSVAAQILHDGERDRRFTATGFTNDAMRLAGHERHVEIDDGGDLAGAGEVGNAEIAALQDRGGPARFRRAVGLACHGFSPVIHQSRSDISRRPSAIRLKPRMRLETARAGISSM
jgi:hypothetical protein